ncbi:MAG: nucleoid-associated protein, partial [Abditibacteriota bacterium]|nr:nucleoid-associated protein [Abditibacteriota bacterium]
WFYDTHENLGINVTYLAFVEFTDTERNKDYIAVLLLDPVRSFRLLDDKVAFEQVSALPDPGKPVNRGMIAGVSSDNAKYDFIFRNKSKGRGEEPEVGKSWTEGFLEGKSIPTPRQMTQLVVKETEKWIGENQNELEPEEPEALRETVKTLAQSEEMDVMAAANAALKEDEMKARYVDGLLQKGLPETTFTPDKDWAEKYAKKITYVCDLNVTVSGNSDAVKEIVKIDTSDPARTFLNIETKKLTQR